jgi:hypothetical protein
MESMLKSFSDSRPRRWEAPDLVLLELTDPAIKTIDLSVPCPALTLVAQHAVVTIKGNLCPCVRSEHALCYRDSNPVPWLFRCVRGA